MNPENLDLFVALVQATAVHKELLVPEADVVKALLAGVKTVVSPHVDASQVIAIIKMVCAVTEVVCPIVDTL